MNEQLAKSVIETLIESGVKDVCICPGGRNSPLAAALAEQSLIKYWWWFEERSAAFFALGRSRRDDRPAAVITTSGTAVGELMPAAMEAFYTGTPLVLVSADRPRRFRGTGAPQTAEQVGIFGVYTPFIQDLAEGESCSLHNWDQCSPTHINVCFEEPLG